MTFKIVIFFSQSLKDFRLPELDSIATLHGIHLSYDRSADTSSPFMLVDVASESEARLLGSRCILIRYIIHHWADADNYEDLHAALRLQPELWSSYIADAAFRITCAASYHKITMERQRDIVNSFAYMGFRGRIDLTQPDIDICVYEDHEEGRVPDYRDSLRHIWSGRKICDGRRDLIDRFDIKKRAYIGNTTMESEVSLVMANMALAAPGKLLYDPFAGTGSMLYTAGYFGAYVVGSDVDGRPMRGHRAEKAASAGSAQTSIVDSGKQYDMLSRLAGCLVFDLVHHPWRTSRLFDAILCDPPYGVRAGAKRIGRTTGLKDEPFVEPSGIVSHKRDDYLPPFEPWPMEEVLDTLLRVSRDLLKVGGRLVYFLPTVTAEYSDEDVPKLPGMRLVANSEQSFGKWARRLITMERIADSEGQADGNGLPRKTAAHAEFRHKYFAGFHQAAYTTR